jgi:hypothetical protein
MDDELRRWAATWKQMKALDMDIVRRAKSAYRTEAAWQLFEVLGMGVSVVLDAGWSAWMLRHGEVSVADWMLMGLLWSGLVIGASSVVTRRGNAPGAESRSLIVRRAS